MVLPDAIATSVWLVSAEDGVSDMVSLVQEKKKESMEGDGGQDQTRLLRASWALIP